MPSTLRAQGSGLAVALLISAGAPAAAQGAQSSLVSDIRTAAPRTAAVTHARVAPEWPASRAVTLRLDDASLEDALLTIARQAELKVTYSREAFHGAPRISVYFEGGVEEAFAQVLSGTGLQALPSTSDRVAILRPPGGLVPGGTAPGVGSLVVQGTISGTVMVAATGEPLPGVQVMVANTPHRALTRTDGSYSIPGLPQGSYSVRATRIGYTPDEMVVRVDSGRVTRADFRLRAHAVQLESVVSIGYGSQRRRDVTGSVGSIEAAEIERGSVTSLDQAMQGRVAGVDVIQTSGQPGGATRVRIRGGTSISAGNEPLYVIDGIPVYNDNADAGVIRAPSTNALSLLNPSDIESIEVLKDASATAIYGSRGANGVVIVTTRRGRGGQNQIEFESSVGVQEVRRVIPVLGARDYALWANERFQLDRLRHDGKNPDIYTEEQVASYGEGTNWQEELFRPAPIQHYQLRFSGGDTGSTRYAISAGYMDQQGVIRNSEFNRYSLRVNLDRNLRDRFRIGSSLNLSRTDSDVAFTGGEGGVEGANSSIVAAALFFNPILPVRDPATGEYTKYNQHVGAAPGAVNTNVLFTNPVAYAELATNRNRNTSVLANVFGEVDLAENLSLRSSLGVDYYSNRQNRHEPSVLQMAASQGGIAAVGSVDRSAWVNENVLTYRHGWSGLHDLTLLGGITAQASRQERLSSSASGFADDNLKYYDLGAGAVQRPASTYVGEWSLLSYLARAHYALADRYLFTATFRADGSSRFGADNRYGYFPSFAAAWRASEEPFVQRLGVFSDLKLRTSYGVTGNQEIGLYEAAGVLGTSRYAFDGQPQLGFAPSNLANPDLRWETTRQFDVGVDAGFFDNRLYVTADYYRKDTRDLLLDVQIPTTSGFQSSLQNVGSVRNEGVELAIEGLILDGPLSWNASFNVARNRNRVMALGGEQQRFVESRWNMLKGQPASVLRVGEPIGHFYGWKTDGVFQTDEEVANSPDQTIASGTPKKFPGSLRWVDQNGDDVVDEDDRVFLGNALPDFTGGFASNLRYGPFELSTLWAFSYGNEVYNFNKQEQYFGLGRQNPSTDWLNRWSPFRTPDENAKATTPVLREGRYQYKVIDLWIEDASFLRMRDLTLAMELPVEQLRLPMAQRARLYVSGRNLVTFTSYSGYDPEVNIGGQSNLLLGYDYSSYPTAKSYTVGVTLGF